MTDFEWTEQMSREYADYMERNVPHDHRKWARRIGPPASSLPARFQAAGFARAEVLHPGVSYLLRASRQWP